MKNIDPKVIKTKNNRKMMLSRCSTCSNKKSIFVSQGSGWLDSLRLNTTASGFKKLKNTTKPSSSILADELHKPIIRKFNKRKVYSQFKDNIWGVDLADMQSLSRKNKGIKYLLCAIDLYSKYAFVIPLKDKKGISIVNEFNEIIKQSNGKPNKIWVDQGEKF